MAKKNVRNMKVCGQSGYKYETVPAITLKGKWLEELGFHLGNYVQVKCENGQLIITPDVIRCPTLRCLALHCRPSYYCLSLRHPSPYWPHRLHRPPV